MTYTYTPLAEPLRFPAVGACIYCGATEALSDEHVVPFGLGGNLILPESSCPACAGRTSAFELAVLRGFMLRARTAASLPTRRPKQRPRGFDVSVIDRGRDTTVRLPAIRFPALLYLPVFEPLGCASGSPSRPGITVCGCETLSFGQSPIDALKRLAVRTLRLSDRLDVFSFVRMLAKIGYSYAVGVKGPMDLANVAVLPLIRGQSEDARRWVGSAQFNTQAEAQDALHSLALVEGDTPHGPVVIARIKLFASSGVSGYEVIVTTPAASWHLQAAQQLAEADSAGFRKAGWCLACLRAVE